MKLPFGYRFLYVSISSFLIAGVWLYVALSAADDDATDPVLNIRYASARLSLLVITLGFCKSFGEILITRVRNWVFIVYLLCGAFIGVLAAISALELFVTVQENGFSLSRQRTLQAIAWSFAAPVLIAFLPPFIAYRLERISEHPAFRQLFTEGRGGSARWAGPGTLRRYRIRLQQNLFSRPGSANQGVFLQGIVLGRALFEDDPFMPYIGIKDDSHMITVGSTGSEKARSVIFSNGCLYPGSMIFLDINGEHAKKLYDRRSSLEWLASENIFSDVPKNLPGGQCYILDPFGAHSHCYNPMSEIDIHSPGARAMITAISDGCFLPETRENGRIEEASRNIFEGFIVHAMTKYPNQCHNLPFVYDLIRGYVSDTGIVDFVHYKGILTDMLANNAAGGLAQEAARLLLDLGDVEKGAMISTISRSLKWIGDPAMRKHLAKSDFSFSEIGAKEGIVNTVFIILPDIQIKEQMRWLRTLTSIGIRAMQTRESLPEIPTLFIIDEFPRLGGKIEAVYEGFRTLTHYKIKLWSFTEAIGQLEHDYPGEWSAMMENANVQIFGVGMGDHHTAQWVSKTLGKRVFMQTDGWHGWRRLWRKRIVGEEIRELLTASEVMTKLGKSANIQIVFPKDGLPMRLERLTYKPIRIGRKKFKSFGLDGLRGHFTDW